MNNTQTWIPVAGSTPTLGTELYVATGTSRRKAIVIATKPGFALLSYSTV